MKNRWDDSQTDIIGDIKRFIDNNGYAIEDSRLGPMCRCVMPEILGKDLSKLIKP